MAADERSPLDRVLDVAVYGPLGLAIAARDSMPKWIEAGRRRLGAQLPMAKTIGRFAVDRGSRQAGEVLRQLAEEAEGVLVALGLVPPEDDLDDETAEPVDVPEPSTNGSGSATAAATSGTSPSGTAASGTSPSGTSAPGAAGERGGLDPAHLAIPGYDTLSASQIVQRLPGLSPDELEAVRLHELAGRSRKTVLLRVAQLKAGS